MDQRWALADPLFKENGSRPRDAFDGRAIDDFERKVVIIDPITNLTNVGTESDVKFMLTRLVDYLKTRGITTLCTSLMDSEEEGQAAQGISSFWIRLRMYENGNERNRSVSVVSLEAWHIYMAGTKYR